MVNQTEMTDVTTNLSSRNEVEDNIHIVELLNNLDLEDEEEIDMLLDDRNFVSNEEDVNWEFDRSLMTTGLGECMDPAGSNLVFVNGINCAAHTLQLAVKGAIALLPACYSNVIKLATKVCKFLRKESTRNEARNLGLKIKLPSIHTPVRWSSTYIMVCYLFLSYYTKRANVINLHKYQFYLTTDERFAEK